MDYKDYDMNTWNSQDMGHFMREEDLRKQRERAERIQREQQFSNRPRENKPRQKKGKLSSVFAVVTIAATLFGISLE